jgi:glycosyltransferase involved in cell wall biosynthesis
MRLCIITRQVNQGDGQGRVNYEVVSEALRRGHTVTLLASSLAPELQHHPQVHWVNIPVQGYPTQLLRDRIFAYRSAKWLTQYRPTVDIVQVNGASTNHAAEVNAVHFVHSTWLQSPGHISQSRRDAYGFYHWTYSKLNSIWEQRSFKCSKVMIAVSATVKHELMAIGVPVEAIRVIANGVDTQEFVPGVVDRNSLGLPKAVPLALFIGDLRTTRKNLDTVLQALVQVPQLHLAVVGDTQKSPYLALVEQLQLKQRVHFLGYRRDIPLIMQAADFFVLPSRYEPFGMVITEAMATGLPVITTANVGASDLIDADSGIVLPDLNDAVALAQAMEKLSHDADLRYRMGQAARTIAERHSWAEMATQYIDLFESLCASKLMLQGE